MSVEQLITLSRIFLGIGILLLILAVVMYVKLDIYRAWHIVTGRQIKEKEIKSGKRIAIKNSQKIATEKIKEKLMKAKVEERTEVLTSQPQEDEDRTIELDRQDKTEPLTVEQIPATAPLEGIRMKYDVTFIHTEVRI